MKRIQTAATLAVAMLALCSGAVCAADKVNNTHADMAAKGWKFAGFDLYADNGDMQGAFVTCTRE